MNKLYFVIAAIAISVGGCASHSLLVPAEKAQLSDTRCNQGTVVTSFDDTAVVSVDSVAIDTSLLLPRLENFISKAHDAAFNGNYPVAIRSLDTASSIIDNELVTDADDSLRTVCLDRIASIFTDLMPAEYLDSASDEISMLIFQREFSDSYDSLVPGGNDSLLSNMLSCRKNTSYNVPIVNNGRVNRALQFICRGKKGPIHKWLARAQYYLPVMKKMFADSGLPTDLAYLPLIESGFNPKAYSRARAAGIWQFIPSTGRRYDLRESFWVDERRDPIKATAAAISYLRKLFAQFNDWHLALAAYNCGENGVQRTLDRQNVKGYWDLTLPRETMGYVPQFVAAVIVAKNYECFGFALPPVDTLSFDAVPVNECIDLSRIARGIGIEQQTLQALNPHILQWCTPPDMDITLYVPRGLRDTFVSFAANLPSEDKIRWHRYVIRKGDNVGAIARKFHLSVEALKSVNKMHSNTIRAGRYLLIPVPSNASIPEDLATDNGVRQSSPSLSGSNRQSVRKPGAASTAAVAPGELAANGKAIKYKVKPGETLWGLAGLFECTIPQIRDWNNLDEKEPIKAGQILTLYTGNAAEPSKKSSGVSPVAEAKKPTASVDLHAPAKDPKPSYNSHRVAKGETFYGIGRIYSVSVPDLRSTNNLDENAILKEGMVLKIPAAKNQRPTVSSDGRHVVYYTVKKGDTVSEIADTFGVPVEKLYALNGLSKGTLIMPGDTIRIVVEEKL